MEDELLYGLENFGVPREEIEERMTFALEESPQTLFEPFVEIPVSSPVVSRSARHKSHLYLRPLFRRERRTHDAVDSFRERTIAAENKNLVIPFLH